MTLILHNEGIDLHKLLTTVDISRENRLDLYLQLVSAVAFLHSEDEGYEAYCHRDLKPSNAVVKIESTMSEKHHHLRLADFGYACPVDPTGTEQLSGACGSPGFYAPEMFTSDAYDGREADVWSLGVILMELMLGEKM